MEPFLESTLVPVLRSVLDPLHQGLNALPPWMWRAAVIGYILVGSLWVCFLKRESIFAGSPSDARRWDLRIWVPLVLIPYVLIYLFL